MTAVRLRRAVCLLGRFPALAGADLEVARGEIVLLSGPNGAGKTTVLRVLAGLAALHSGDGEVLGHDLARGRAAVRPRLAYVGHDTGAYDELTVAENAAFFARAAGLDRAAADAALEQLGLQAQRSVLHGACSAGQRRRLAIAMALVREPELLLLDEPHAGLDPDARELIDGVIAASPAAGRTVIFSSHELDRARDLAHREVEVRGGLVFALGAPRRSTALGDAAGSPRAVAS